MFDGFSRGQRKKGKEWRWGSNHSSLEGITLKLSKPFPRAALWGKPCKGALIIAMGHTETSSPCQSHLCVKYHSVHKFSLGFRNAQSQSHCVLSLLGHLRFEHTESSAPLMGMCVWRACWEGRGVSLPRGDGDMREAGLGATLLSQEPAVRRLSALFCTSPLPPRRQLYCGAARKTKTNHLQAGH